MLMHLFKSLAPVSSLVFDRQRIQISLVLKFVLVFPVHRERFLLRSLPRLIPFEPILWRILSSLSLQRPLFHTCHMDLSVSVNADILFSLVLRQRLRQPFELALSVNSVNHFNYFEFGL